MLHKFVDGRIHCPQNHTRRKVKRGGIKLEIWRYTRAQFMCGKTSGDGHGPSELWETLQSSLNQPNWLVGTEREIPERPGFATAVANRSGANPGDLVLLRKEGDSWVGIGGYIDTILTISPDYRRKGLSTELILRACEGRQLPAERLVTIEGYAALAKAHGVGVRRAIAQGLLVPDVVRAEYDAEEG